MKRLVVAFACAVGLTAAACDSSTAGTPTAQQSSPPATSVPSVTETPAPTTSGLLPPRPRDIDLTGVDPCKVLTYQQMHELAYDLGYQRPPQPAGTSTWYHGPICGYGSIDPPDQPSRYIGSDIGISTSEGAEAWLTDPERKSPQNRVESVDGFPAVVVPEHNKVLGYACGVEVDVHDGQYLEVGSDVDPSKAASSKSSEPYCTEAKRVAGRAIQTIESR